MYGNRDIVTESMAGMVEFALITMRYINPGPYNGYGTTLSPYDAALVSSVIACGFHNAPKVMISSRPSQEKADLYIAQMKSFLGQCRDHRLNDIRCPQLDRLLDMASSFVEEFEIEKGVKLAG